MKEMRWPINDVETLISMVEYASYPGQRKEYEERNRGLAVQVSVTF